MLECLNLAIALATFFIIDRFLSGNFSTYGSDAINFLSGADSPYYNPDTRTNIDPMCYAFPTVVSCKYPAGAGPNGIPEKRNTLCILTPNTVNQKIYLILWFWLLLLFVTSVLLTVYRIVIFCSRDARQSAMKRKVNTTQSDRVENLDFSLDNIGEWFIMGQICRNSNIEFSREFLTEMVRNTTKLLGSESPSNEKKDQHEPSNSEINLKTMASNTEDNRNTET